MNGRTAKAMREHWHPNGGAARVLCLDRLVAANMKRVPLSQPLALKVRKHKTLKAIKPTWPRTINQVHQSRPVIVTRPVRAAVRAMLDAAPADMHGRRSLTADQMIQLRRISQAPKHVIDAFALSL